MLFRRTAGLNKLREKAIPKLIDAGMNKKEATDYIMNMSSANGLEQVTNDLSRTAEVIFDNKKFEIRDNVSANNFLKEISQNNPVLLNYLKQYLHQGGFKHSAEVVVNGFFEPKYILTTTNKRAIFTSHQDGSLSYEEKFDIVQIRNKESKELLNENPKSIATISLKSDLVVKNDQVNWKPGKMEIDAHDELAAKLFLDPRNNFNRIILLIKEFLENLTNKMPSFSKDREPHEPEPNKGSKRRP